MSEKNVKSTKKSTKLDVERGSVKYYVIEFVCLFVAAIIIWPLLDMFISAVFTHSEFTYSVFQHILEPALFAVIFTIIDFVIYKCQEKK